MKALKKIAKVSKKSKREKQTTAVVVEVVPKDLQRLVDEWARAAIKAKEAQAEEKEIALQLRPRLQRLLEEKFSEGFRNSIKVAGQEHVVMITIQDRFSSITEENVPLAKKALGKYFQELVEPEVILKVKPHVATNDQKLQEILDLLQDKLEEYFDVELRFKPKKGFLQRIYSLFGPKKREQIKRIFHHATPILRVVG